MTGRPSDASSSAGLPPFEPTEPGAPITDRLLGLRRFPDASFAPDGSRVAFVVAEAHRERGGAPASQVWITTLDGPPRPHTGECAADSLPAWSPDGRELVCASDRATPGRRGGIFRIDPDAPDAEPEHIATVDGTIEAIHWPAATALILLVADPDAESASMEAAIRRDVATDPVVIRPMLAWRRLIRLDLTDRTLHEVGPEGWTIWELDMASPDLAVAVGSRDPSENGWYRSSILILDLASRAVRVLHESPWQLASPSISPDRSRVAFIEGWASDRGLVAADVQVRDIRDGTTVPVGSPESDVAWVRWRDARSVWFAGASGVGTKYGWLGLDDAGDRSWTEAGTLRLRYQSQVVPSPDGEAVVAVLDTPDHPPELAWRRLDSTDNAWGRLTNLNGHVADLAQRRRIRSLRWLSVDGLEIEGLLVEPALDDAGPRPLVVNIHGGPTAGHRLAFLPHGTWMAIDPGYPVLLVNYRGTPGYGASFTRGNVGDPGGLELQDILTGVDACVASGIADPDRIAVMGGSYGGYLTAWAVTQTTRFACGIVDFGISDLLSCHRSCNNPAFYEFILGVTPHGEASLRRYVDRSPIAHVANVRTPVLLLHGEKDLCTPVGQAQEFFQALSEGAVETELVVYPREGHGSGNWERDHQRDHAARIRGWLALHLASKRRAS